MYCTLYLNCRFCCHQRTEDLQRNQVCCCFCWVSVAVLISFTVSIYVSYDVFWPHLSYCRCAVSLCCNNAMHSVAYAIARCSSVCLSHLCILSKRLNISSPSDSPTILDFLTDWQPRLASDPFWIDGMGQRMLHFTPNLISSVMTDRPGRVVETLHACVLSYVIWLCLCVFPPILHCRLAWSSRGTGCTADHSGVLYHPWLRGTASLN